MATRTQRAPPRARGTAVDAPPAATTSRVRAGAIKKVEEKEKPKVKAAPVDIAVKAAVPSRKTVTAPLPTATTGTSRPRAALVKKVEGKEKPSTTTLPAEVPAKVAPVRRTVVPPSNVATTSRVRLPPIKAQDKEQRKPQVVPVDVGARLASPASCTPLLASHFTKQLETSTGIESDRLSISVINAALKSLAAAVAQGLKASSVTPDPVLSRTSKALKDDKGQWSLASVKTVLQMSSTALNTLRQLHMADGTDSERILVRERAGLSLLGKAVALGMVSISCACPADSRWTLLDHLPSKRGLMSFDCTTLTTKGTTFRPLKSMIPLPR